MTSFIIDAYFLLLIYGWWFLPIIFEETYHCSTWIQQMGPNKQKVALHDALTGLSYILQTKNIFVLNVLLVSRLYGTLCELPLSNQVKERMYIISWKNTFILKQKVLSKLYGILFFSSEKERKTVASIVISYLIHWNKAH